MREYFEDEVLGKAYDGKLMRRFLGYLKPHRWLVTAVFAIVLAGVGVQVLSPLILRDAIDGPVAKGDRSGLMVYAVFFLAAIIAFSLLELLHIIAASLTGQRIIYDLRLQLFSHLQRLPAAFFDKNPVGRLVVRTTNDVENLNELFTSGLVEVFANVLILAGLLVMMFILSWQLTLVTLGVAPLVLAAILIFRKYARERYREMRRKLAKMSAYLAECIQGMRVIKMFNKQAYCQAKFGRLNDDFTNETVGAVLLYSIFYPFIELVSSVLIAVLVWYGGGRILEGSLGFGSFLAFWYCATKLFEPLRDLSEKYNILQAAMASSERIFKILDTPVEPKGGEKLEIKGGIEFRNVSFSYDGQKKVLDNVSFTVRPGEKLAIVGFTGAGKTTLISLLTRMYEVTEGQILIDGRDIKEYDLETLRRAFGVVSQDVFLFAGTIEENIRLGNAETPFEKIAESARYVNLDRIVTKFPAGFRTDVRERGVALSAGERQLISFARAIHYDPKVIVLDEATSYVDMETEHLVQDAIFKLISNKTAIIIAHRLATVRTVDRIIVLHHGRIIEEGTHRELYQQGGLYSKLCKIQFAEAVQ